MKKKKVFLAMLFAIMVTDNSWSASQKSKMTTSVRIAGIILKWVPKNREKNYNRAEKLIRQASAKGAKIVFTPESFLDGYSIRDRDMSFDEFCSFAEPVPGGKYIKKLQQLAAELRIYLAAGLTELSGDKVYNTALLIGTKGDIIGKYRKKFLWGYEKDKYTAGDKFPVFKTEYGNIGMMICADRRKPEAIAELKKKGAEIVYCPAGGGYGPRNDRIVSQRSKEGKVVIIFVHPVEFLVTGPNGEILEQNLFGNTLDEDDNNSHGGVVRLYDLEFIYD